MQSLGTDSVMQFSLVGLRHVSDVELVLQLKDMFLLGLNVLFGVDQVLVGLGQLGLGLGQLGGGLVEVGGQLVKL